MARTTHLDTFFLTVGFLLTSLMDLYFTQFKICPLLTFVFVPLSLLYLRPAVTLVSSPPPLPCGLGGGRCALQPYVGRLNPSLPHCLTAICLTGSHRWLLGFVFFPDLGFPLRAPVIGPRISPEKSNFCVFTFLSLSHSNERLTSSHHLHHHLPNIPLVSATASCLPPVLSLLL